ncbi:dihydrofolate reductase family protein [Microlunatus parietis]|uniref:Dihydrofolate reductase n=1 Tax=Microlunatus parietis TaxID=682979 RepID=A0A7Y9I1Y4_9ACTN|nr:dihydrofolate reductase family protein [Microlunatus parietis]NYE68752.1 dihydrofolate reductase [Microlunatus parietis]
MSGSKLVVAQNITANGVIEFVEPWFDPGEQDDTDDLVAVMQDHMRREEALLLGRQTFEDFRGYWPHQTADSTGITEHLNRVPKYVVSSTLTDPAWEHSTVLSGPLTEQVAALKAGGSGGDLGVTGSISVVHELIRADLVDEYRLFVFPVITSRGRTLVPDGVTLRNLTLAEAVPFRSGVVLQVYTTR